MPRLSNRQPVLKPQDLYLLLVLAACRDRGTTYPELAEVSGLAMSAVHAALKRAEAARLLHFEAKRPHVVREAFKEFLFHGARYAFPPLRGGMVAGLPTGHAAEPLSAHIAASSEPPPVWPSAAGKVRGLALFPAAAAALNDPPLYQSLALFDAVRAGNARERTLARKMLEDRL